MHFPEGLFSFQFSALWAGLAAVFLIDSFVQSMRVFREGRSEQKALLGMVGIFIFALSFIPLPIPLLGGLCVHICATPFVAILLGPRFVVLPTFVSLLAQLFLFGHGGLTTLGASLLSFGVFAPWVAFLTVRVLLLLRAPILASVFLAVTLGVLVASALDAGVLSMSVYGWAALQVWYPKMLAGLMTVRVPLALLEAFMSALLVRGIYQRRSTLLPGYLQSKLGVQSA